MSGFAEKALETIKYFKNIGVENYNSKYNKKYYTVKFAPNNNNSSLNIKINIPILDFRQPPLDFENKHRLVNISGSYKIIHGLRAEELQTYAMITLKRNDINEDDRIKEMLNICSELTKINPELEKIKKPLTSVNSMYHFILGVASDFNIDDINHFIFESSSRAKGQEMEESAEFKNLTKSFNTSSCKKLQHFGMPHLGWIASPKTLSKISGQLLEQKLIQEGQHPMIKRNFPEADF